MPVSEPVLPSPVAPPHLDSSLFTHTPSYCEENVYLLCKKLCMLGLTDREGRDLFVVFISNQNKQIPLWHQKASSRIGGLIIWDYHVICIQRHGEDNSLHQVWDLDSSLPFPSPLNEYVTEAIKPSVFLNPQFARLFRVVHAPIFLRCFASDRRHMKNPDGNWISPPPTYEPIVAEDGTIYNLDDYIQMRGRDLVITVGELVDRIFSERLGVVVDEMLVEELFSVMTLGVTETYLS